MNATVDIYNQEQITAALGQIKTALDSLISVGIPVDLTGYVRTDHTGDVEIDGDVNIGNDLIVDGDISGDGLEVATALIGESTMPTGALLAVGGGIIVTNRAGNELSIIDADGGATLHGGWLRWQREGGVSVAAGDAIARCVLPTSGSGAIVVLTFSRPYNGVTIATFYVQRSSGYSPNSKVIKSQQDFFSGRKIKGVDADGYVDFMITDTSDVNVAADTAHSISVKMLIIADTTASVTFPNH